MGPFWSKLTETLLDSIYACTVPTADDLISQIEANEVTAQDQKITTGYNRFFRYVRTFTKSELSRFLRFVTGSESFPAKTVIKVEYVDQSNEHLHPVVKTCFKILILSRQFGSLYQFKETLDFYDP